jgi:hypothetical protein
MHGRELVGQSVRAANHLGAAVSGRHISRFPPAQRQKKAAAASGRRDRLGDPDPTRRVT